VTKKKLLLYVLIPLVYVTVIVIFLFFAFAKGDSISEKIGDLVVEGSLSRGIFRRKSKITELRLSYRGLRLSLDRGLHFGADSQSSSPVSAYNVYQDGMEVIFQGGARLQARIAGTLGDELIVSFVSVPETSVSIPFTVPESGVEQAEGFPVFSFQNGDVIYFLSLPEGSSIDFATGFLHLDLSSGDQEGGIRVTRAQKALDNIYLYWYAQSGFLVDEQALRRSVTAFVDNAYQGWDSQRYVMGTGVWNYKGREDRFSEVLATAWIAESLERGEYRKSTAFTRAALGIRLEDDPQLELQYAFSPFIGELEKYKESYREREAERSREIDNLIRRKDPSVFKIPNLVAHFLNQSSLSQIDDLVSQIVASVDIGRQDMATCLGMLESYLDIKRWYQESESYFRRFKEVISDRILPSLHVIEQGMFLETTPEGASDILLNLKAGRLLMETGAEEGNDVLVSAGRHLIVSSLSLSDNLGFLPERVSLSSGKVVVSEPAVFLAPEDVYDVVTERSYIPEAKPLYPVLDPGNWVWTAAKIESFSVEDDELKFVFGFPPGSTHYLMFQGIAPFRSVSLKGSPWVGNPSYARFASGWFYDETQSCLYVKLRQDDSLEEIIIRY
jgi:hypothetical protein